jgi:hypothetical protein
MSSVFVKNKSFTFFVQNERQAWYVEMKPVNTAVLLYSNSAAYSLSAAIYRFHFAVSATAFAFGKCEIHAVNFK